jgi:hypothetical protein
LPYSGSRNENVVNSTPRLLPPSRSAVANVINLLAPIFLSSLAAGNDSRIAQDQCHIRREQISLAAARHIPNSNA